MGPMIVAEWFVLCPPRPTKNLPRAVIFLPVAKP